MTRIPLCLSTFPTIGIDNPPVLKTDTQETENLDKAIFS
jgi:hypothetical protein